MSTVRYHKLVRDRIPQIIEQDGRKCRVRRLSDAEYLLMLDEKPQSLNLSVQSMDEDGFYYLSAKNKQQARYLRYDDVLAAAYKRGDSGEGTDIKENEG